MKRILLLAAVVAVAATLFCLPQSPPQPAKPQPVKQDITVVYGYMTFSEAEYLGCVQLQAGWACQLTGAGGGRAFKD